MTYNIPEPKI